jgi:hypothetical protein
MFNIITNISMYELLINELIFLELFINKFLIPTMLFPVWSKIVIRVVVGGIEIEVHHFTIVDFLHR